MAISVVTRPRSSRQNGERTADEVRQEALHGAALEHDGQQPRKASRGHRRDRVFGGGRSAFRV